jgi:hypothetical protein
MHPVIDCLGQHITVLGSNEEVETTSDLQLSGQPVIELISERINSYEESPEPEMMDRAWIHFAKVIVLRSTGSSEKLLQQFRSSYDGMREL